MSLANHVGVMRARPDLVERMIYGALLPMCFAAEGLRRLNARMASDADDIRPAPLSWLSEARCGAEIAASYVLLARHELKSSERLSRPVRPS